MQALVSRRSAFHVRAIWIVAIALAPETRAAAPEYLLDDESAPASVVDQSGPMEEAYPVEVPAPSIFPSLKKRLETADPFWRDTQLL